LHEALTDAEHCAFLVDAADCVQPLAAGLPLREVPPLVFRLGRLFHPDARAQRSLSELLRLARMGQRVRFAIPGAAGPLRIEAMPLPPRARLTENQPLVLLRVREQGRSSLPNERELAAYFDLTPTQARVLRLLCDGSTIAKCAERLDCRLSTVRTHVAQLILRMDCKRQAQLERAAMMLAG
jgi:DNA-binding CsgD family transcriptional regulator